MRAAHKKIEKIDQCLINQPLEEEELEDEEPQTPVVRRSIQERM